MYQLPPEFAERGQFAVADAQGASLEPFAYVFKSEEIPKLIIKSL